MSSHDNLSSGYCRISSTVKGTVFIFAPLFCALSTGKTLSWTMRTLLDLKFWWPFTDFKGTIMWKSATHLLQIFLLIIFAKTISRTVHKGSGWSVLNKNEELKTVFRICISFHADPDPGSLKCPYGSGSGSRPLIFYSDPDPDPKGVKIKEDNLYKQIFN